MIRRLLRSRRTDDAAEGFGSDSFLDIVANIVGILIILVMVVGVRVKYFVPQPPDPEPLPDTQAAQAALQQLQQQYAALQETLAATRAAAAERLQRVEQTELAIARERIEMDADAQRRRLQAEQVEALQTQVAQQHQRLQALEAQVRQAAAVRPTAVQVESYPTPVSTTVQGPEVHFQLLQDHVAWVPFDELAQRMKDDVRGKQDLLRSSPRLTATVGPVHGFRWQYTVARVGSSSDPALSGQVVIQFIRGYAIPDRTPLGEPLDVALQPTSRFRALLARHDPQTTTVTLWTYPDSFDTYRRLKKELYLLGYTVAGRPLPEGRPIGAAPSGSRSAGQ
jgi:multidrug efflux pump subunit AcrA (membrane-fusion protein)